MPVPMLDLRAQYQSIKSDVLSAIENVFETQGFVGGPNVLGLEKEIAAYVGSGEALSCASGTDALLLALKAVGAGPGREVITTTFSFFATAGTIANTGAMPIFVDIDPVTFNIDPAQIEAKINERTCALLPVHLYGQCAEMDTILEIGLKNRLPVIEDSAQGLGAKYKGRNACSMGAAAAISFYPTKNLGGAGDGGMVMAHDADIASKVKLLRNHGAETTYIHRIVGTNSRLDAIQAAVLRIKLAKLDEWNDMRRENAAYYNQRFADVPEVLTPVELPGNRHIYHQYVIRLKDRDAAKAYLTERGIGCAVFYPLPLHQQECFQSFGSDKTPCPEAEKAAGEVLALPIYPELSRDQQDIVVDALKDFFAQQ